MFKNTGWLDASGPRAKELLERKAREHKVKLPSGLRFALLFAACAPIAAVNGVSACCVRTSGPAAREVGLCSGTHKYSASPAVRAWQPASVGQLCG